VIDPRLRLSTAQRRPSFKLAAQSLLTCRSAPAVCEEMRTPEQSNSLAYRCE
jgi:hypothetical protein